MVLSGKDGKTDGGWTHAKAGHKELKEPVQDVTRYTKGPSGVQMHKKEPV